MATAAVSEHMPSGSHTARTTKPKREWRLHLSTARIWIVAVIVTAFVFMFSFTKAWGERMDRLDVMANSDVFIGKTYSTIDGGQYLTDGIKGTKLTAFNVWSTTRPPCIGEMPDLEKLNQSYPDSEFRVVGILSDTAKSDGTVIQKHLEEANKITVTAGVTFRSSS